MKVTYSLMLLSLFSFTHVQAASQCSGRFTPFEMLKVGVDKTWVTLRAVSETRQCESVYGKVSCNDWQKQVHATPFIKKLSLQLVSKNKSVYAQGTHYKKTRGYFTWKPKQTLMELRVKKSVSGRGSCRQWGAAGGVGYGGCRSYNTVTREVAVGVFKGRVSETCADLVGPITKSERTYFSEDTFAYTETRKSLRN